MEDKVLMTKSSLQKFEDELNHMKTTMMRECLQDLADAKDKGDISENAEYDIAKEQLENLQLRIKTKEDTLRRVVLIDESSIDTSKVGILTKVSIENINNSTKAIYSIVPENEIDVRNGKISINSPIAKSLVGREVGEVVEFQAPAGLFKFKILKIDKL